MTELRHRNGQATPHVKALQAARRSLISSASKRGANEPEVPPERQKRLRMTTPTLAAPLIEHDSVNDELVSSEAGVDEAAADALMHDAGGDTYSDDAEKQSHENPSWHVEVPDADTNCDLAAAAATSARDRVWSRDGYLAVVEDSSDNEDDNFSGESDSDTVYNDSSEDEDGLSVFDRINGDFERELAEFGMAPIRSSLKLP
jgi:hypothetical protein